MYEITKVKCAYDKLEPISELKSRFNPKNRNKHPDDQIQRLAKILEYQGARRPAVISNRSQLLTVGHGRILSAERLGWTHYPVNFQDYESEEQEYADLQADNAIASWAELDLSGINSDIGDLGPDFDIDLLGIKDFTLEPAEKFEPQCDEDEIPEAKETRCKPGDIWQLGSHRLMCGDSTSIDAVEKLMAGEKAEMVFTDPPYGMFLDADFSSMASKFKGSNGGNKYENVKGDHEDFKPELINTVFAAFPKCKEVFLWGADYFAEILPDKNSGSWVVWDKRGDESADRMFGSVFEMCWSKAKHKREIARVKWAGIFGMEKEHDKKRVHPTQKPVELVVWFLDRFSKEKNTVVDLFGGSGSTLIACEKTDRKCFMMEIDPHYVDVILARWEKYTGKTAERLNG